MKAVLRDYPGAIEDYGKAIEHPSADRDLFGPISFNRANAKVRLRCFDDAIKDYDRAVRSGPKEADFNKANALVFLGRFREAFQCYGHKSLREGQYSSQAAHNQDSVKKSLDNLGKSKFEVNLANSLYGRAKRSIRNSCQLRIGDSDVREGNYILEYPTRSSFPRKRESRTWIPACAGMTRRP